MRQWKIFLAAIGMATIIACPALAAQNAKQRQEMTDIKSNCKDKWHTDYEMQDYCVRKQVQALNDVVHIMNGHLSQDEKEMLANCSVKWKQAAGADWEMTRYCYRKQHAAYERLNASN